MLALITFYRHIKYTFDTVKIERLSDVITLFVNCIIISIKALNDSPVNVTYYADILKMKASQINIAEIEILKSIDYNLFFSKEDVEDLENVFPLDGLMSLSYSSEKPEFIPEDAKMIFIPRNEVTNSAKIINTMDELQTEKESSLLHNIENLSQFKKSSVSPSTSTVSIPWSLSPSSAVSVNI